MCCQQDSDKHSYEGEEDGGKLGGCDMFFFVCLFVWPYLIPYGTFVNFEAVIFAINI